MSDSVTLWTEAYQAPLSMGCSRQELWSGLPCPPPRDLPHPGIEPMSPIAPASAGGFLTAGTPWEAHACICIYVYFFRFFSTVGYCDTFSIVPCAI